MTSNKEKDPVINNEEESVSLARLRLFLSPHANEDHQNNDVMNDSEVNAETGASTAVPSYSQQVPTVRALAPTSREFVQVKYMLQASLPGHQLEGNTMIWDMRNPEVVSKYEQHSSGLLELDSWVATQDLGPDNCMKDVYSCGFTSPTKPSQTIKVTTGNLKMDGTKGHGQYVLCKIAVGRSYAVDKGSDTNHLPSGYNSFYIRNEQGSGNGYYHEYVIKNDHQIMPQYLVQFQYAPASTSASPACVLCEAKSATLVCKSCPAVLCKGCDVDVHSANKLVARHKRTALNASTAECSKPLVDSTCGKHTDIPVEFYCPTCSTPVCVHCKMVGDHSCGEPANHRLISISDAYTSAVAESARVDPLIESRESVIGGKMTQIHDRTEEIRINATQVEKIIHDSANEALATLKKSTTTKLQILLGEELELGRQKEHINWAEAYLCEQRRLLGPVEFLNAWHQHRTSLRTELREFPVVHLPSADHVKADLRMLGRLQVITGDENGDVSTANSPRGPSLVKKMLMATSSKVAPFAGEDNNIGTQVLSPKSSQLIAKVKHELTKGASARTLSHIKYKKKDTVQRRPSSSGLDSLTLRGLMSKEVASPRQKTTNSDDAWTRKIREEMMK